MARVKINIPEEFPFFTQINIRIADINYGNHLANHVYLEFMQEARMQFFMHYGFSEKNLGGKGVIMGDTAIVFKHECFYGDALTIAVTAVAFGSKSFDLIYRFTRLNDSEIVCEAKTGMVCFDYDKKETVEVPEAFRKLFAEAI
ncbi:MAG: thioesterase family protein [Bacteroidia bacterium]|nr:thioesterase family protein [Bacteroidia bacterium]